VVLPASGWEIIAKVRRLATSSSKRKLIVKDYQGCALNSSRT
jgi:hypothetical protein